MTHLLALAAAAGLLCSAAEHRLAASTPAVSPARPKVADPKEKGMDGKGPRAATAGLLEAFDQFRERWTKPKPVDPVVYGRHLRTLRVGLERYRDEHKPVRPAGKPAASQAKAPSAPQQATPPEVRPVDPPPADPIRSYEDRTAATHRGPDVAALRQRARERLREQQYEVARAALKKLDELESAVGDAVKKAAADRTYDRVVATRRVVEDLRALLVKLDELAADEAGAGSSPAGQQKQPSSPPTEVIP